MHNMTTATLTPETLELVKAVAVILGLSFATIYLFMLIGILTRESVA